MGQAKQRGTYEERRANPKGYPAPRIVGRGARIWHDSTTVDGRHISEQGPSRPNRFRRRMPHIKVQRSPKRMARRIAARR